MYFGGFSNFRVVFLLSMTQQEGRMFKKEKKNGDLEGWKVDGSLLRFARASRQDDAPCEFSCQYRV